MKADLTCEEDLEAGLILTEEPAGGRGGGGGRGAQTVELLQEEGHLTLCCGDESPDTCFVRLRCPDCVRGRNVHIAAERPAGDQCGTEADR